MESYEQACEGAKVAADEAEKAARRLVAASHGMARAAKEGDPTKLRQALRQIEEAALAAQQSADAARSAWPYTEDEISDYLGSRYEDELIVRGAGERVKIDRLDDRLAAFPVVVQVMSKQRAIRLDKTRLSGLRPSFVLGRIRVQQKKSGIAPAQFIEVLFRAYSRLVGDRIGDGVKMADVHDVLTILPDAKRSYGKAEFARDVFQLDASDVKVTGSGARVSFPAATGTRGGRDAFVVVPPDGMPKHYYGLRFEGAQ